MFYFPLWFWKKVNVVFLQNPSEAQRKEHDKFDFELHEVYAIDVLISTGEGQGKDRDAKITIYKKTDETYMLKVSESIGQKTLYCLEMLLNRFPSFQLLHEKCFSQFQMKNSREFYSTVQKKFGAMPFNLRSFDSETKAKMGVVECVTHKLVEPFQVLHEKDSK